MRASRAAAAAVAFLTRVPVGRWIALDGADVARGAALFPAVGAGVGALGGLVAAGLDGPLPALVGGAVGIATVALLTGALHLDALADTADALGGTERAAALAIMRDSRVGSYGVTALALVLLVETSSLGGLAAGGDAVAAFAAAGALSRAVSPPLARLLPYARADAGPGSVLSGRVSAVGALVAALLGAGIAVALLGWDGAVATGAAALVALLAAIGCRLWLGGVTGDTLGAATQVTEAVVLVVILGLR
ncbi:MAG TPA: adenosylcobinamide-GDP ribazoletransferase [Gaiellaceae bacterium]|jgi:cobalamin 5'-phosphate synthase/cobalamin synthase